MLLKEDDAIEMSFDSKNALFKLKSHTLVCRLIEGNYPNYNAVIPANNPNKVLVDRIEPSYYAWMMNGDFPLYTKKVITEIRMREKLK